MCERDEQVIEFGLKREKKKMKKNIWHIRNDDKLCLVEFYFVYFVFASLNSIVLFSSES